MQIKEMFKKSITRDIQGVVIAGQGEKTNIATELEEYVVTPELQRHFADFFSAYAALMLGEVASKALDAVKTIEVIVIAFDVPSKAGFFF